MLLIWPVIAWRRSCSFWLGCCFFTLLLLLLLLLLVVLLVRVFEGVGLCCVHGVAVSLCRFNKGDAVPSVFVLTALPVRVRGRVSVGISVNVFFRLSLH